ncbi:transcriptional regulator [Streptomyces mashuensis]|uniref:Transcriptional regulator n=1 Tax=Streptomyces mashuensis TaxID=33904 RepID=A0A919EB67_9ACTN|nr:winged helix-turn-helix domain-containing protein [Streptomyces mashuensis]GHF32399.1 transcriptional regulator [Streptomyces mashuensis]
MTNLRTVPASSSPASASASASASATLAPPRHRLRAVEPDELPPLRTVPPAAELLHPQATWMPAPAHSLPALPGRPPMIGYLVLVPAPEEPTVTTPAAPAPTAAGPVRIDAEERVAYVDGAPLDLTYLEFELLAHLVAHPHRVHTRDQLVTTVWGYGHVGDGRTVDVHVARLRRKMGAEHRSSIVTVRRVGYKYAPPAGH